MTPLVILARRGLAVVLAALTTALATLAVALLTAAPAAAVPEGWSDPDPVDPTFVILVAVLLPLGLAILLTVLVYGPPLARGESVKPHAPEMENQWIGGPRKAAGELAGPDGEDSDSGGASGRW